MFDNLNHVWQMCREQNNAHDQDVRILMSSMNNTEGRSSLNRHCVFETH